MDNKKTTVALSILLVFLIILLFLRSCGMAPWLQESDDKNWRVPLQEEVSYEEDIAADAGGNSAPESISTNTTSASISVIEDIAALPDLPSVIDKKQEKADAALQKPAAPVQQPVSKPKQAAESAAMKKELVSVPASAQSQNKQDLPQSITKKIKKEVGVVPVYTSKTGFRPFYVYSEVGSKDNHYYPYGFMGDISSIKIDQGCKSESHNGKTSIKISYKPYSAEIAWAGIYWQEPANNWGDKGPGFNLVGAERVSFWAKGEKGGEVISNFIVGGIQGKTVEDSDSRAIGPVELTKDWQQYVIYLDGANLKNIIGGFCVTLTKSNNPDGAVFYLDDIIFE